MAVDAARAKSLVLNASELADPVERAAYLERECGDDAALRQRVEALLAAHDGGGRSVESDATEMSEHTSPETLEATAAADAVTRLPSELATAADRSDCGDVTFPGASRADRAAGFIAGQVIAGRYTLLDVLGEGGMGSVYLAEQTSPVRRMVALKLIKIGMDSRAVLARFDAERQALALMEHPNIARVYDGGTTEAGQPFFVMELVEGEPITQYCDRSRLSVRARLELFVSVCQAVQHAHQKGIIHRDLKPSNVLVTEVDGRATPKVIDFGVAKATEIKLTDQSLGDTGAIVGTPTYMSPEQADPSSMDIDTRTDVYALGVILYELLVGSPPLDAKQFKRGAILEMLRMVREVDPPKPSTKVSTADAMPSIAACRDIEPANLKRSLEGDLDWIVMMALEKDRSRRYETANGFAADILRHLAHEPVVAAPPSRVYRLRKFVRKHRGAVIAASLVLLALLGGLAAVAAVQTLANARLADSLARETQANTALNEANGQLTQSRAAVQARYELATDAIKTFHTGVSEDFLLKEEKFKNLRNRLLKSASDFYGKLGALLGKETDLASRRALSQANFELAELTGKVGRSEDALAAHRQVLAARQALAAEPEADAETITDVGRSLTAIATLLEGVGKSDDAVGTYREAEALLEARAALTPVAAQVRAALADCRSRLGYLLYSTGHAGDGLLVLRQARSEQEVLAGTPKATMEAARELANTINRIGNLLARTGRPSEADVDYRKALAIYQKLAQENPANSEIRRRLGIIANNLGSLLLTIAGRSSESEAAFREALAIRQKLADDNLAVTEFRNDLALSHRNLGEVLSQTGRASESEVEYRKAMTIYQKLAEENPSVSEFGGNLADSLSSLAILLHQTGRTADSQAEFNNAMAIRQKLADDSPTVTKLQSDLARSRHNLGYLLSESGKPEEAEVEYRKATAIYQKLADANPSVTGLRAELANNLLDLGILLSETSRPAESEAEERKAIALYDKLSNDDPDNPGHRVGLAGALYYLGDVIRGLGRPAEAREHYERAIAIHERLVKEDPNPWYRSLLAHSLRRRGLALRELGDVAGGAADTRRALGLYEGLASRSGEETFETACCRAALAGLAGGNGAGVSAAEGKAEADQAIALLRKAIEIGFRKTTAFRTESALGPLREREVFKNLLDKLEKKSPAKPEKSP